MRVAEMLVGVRGDVAIKIFGPELATLNGLAEKMVDAIKGVRGSRRRPDGEERGGAIPVGRRSTGCGRTHGAVDVDDGAGCAARRGRGRVVGTVLEDGRRTPLLLRGGDARARLTGAVRAASRLTLPSGQAVPLTAGGDSSSASTDRSRSTTRTRRRYVVVQANVRGRDLVGFVEEAKQAVARKGTLPAGLQRQCGAGSSRTSSVPRRASRSWCRWRSRSSSCCCSRPSAPCGRRCWCSPTYRSR